MVKFKKVINTNNKMPALNIKLRLSNISYPEEKAILYMNLTEDAFLLPGTRNDLEGTLNEVYEKAELIINSKESIKGLKNLYSIIGKFNIISFNLHSKHLEYTLMKDSDGILYIKEFKPIKDKINLYTKHFINYFLQGITMDKDINYLIGKRRDWPLMGKISET